jgi:competence protein ComEC
MRLVYASLIWTAGLLFAAGNPGGAPAFWAALALLMLAASALHPRLRVLGWAAVFTLAVLRMALVPPAGTLVSYNDGGGATIEGIVQGYPTRTERETRLRVQAERIFRAGLDQPVSGAVLVRLPAGSDTPPGARVRVTGALVSPAVTDRFSYAETLLRQGVTSVMTGAVLAEIAPAPPSIMAEIGRLRAAALARIDSALPEPAAGLLAGIVFGDTGSLSDPLRRAFSTTGVAHVLAVSGFNMIVVAGALSTLLRRLNAPRWPSALAGLSAIALYALLAGGGSSVERAALMSALVVTGEALRRRSFVPASLAAALLGITLISPLALWDLGFQLSLFTTLAVAQFSSPLSQQFARWAQALLPPAAARASVFFSAPLAATLAAQIAAVPLLALAFGTLSVVAPIVNLLIAPLQPLTLLLGGAAVLCALISPALAAPLFALEGVLLMLTIEITRLFAALPGASAAINIAPAAVVFAFALWIGWSIMHAAQPAWWLRLTSALTSRAAVSALATAAALTLILLISTLSGAPDGMLHVWFLDVEGGSAVLARTPGGAHLLFDGGDRPARLLTAIGDRLPFQTASLEVLAVSQPDPARFRALAEAAQRYTPGVLLSSGQPSLDDEWTALEQQVPRRAALSAGSTVAFSDGAQLQALHPADELALDGRLDRSALVLRLSFGQIAFLLTGDLSREGQADMLARGAVPPATVLQIPHPERENSLLPEWVAQIAPSAVVLQTSASTRQDDPAPALLAQFADADLWDSAGGSLHFWTDGTRLWMAQEAAS